MSKNFMYVRILVPGNALHIYSSTSSSSFRRTWGLYCSISISGYRSGGDQDKGGRYRETACVICYIYSGDSGSRAGAEQV